MVVIRFGKIEESDEVIRFNLKFNCNNCNKVVPGGMKSVKNYFKINKFNK